MTAKSQEAYKRYLKVIEIIKDDDIALNLLDNLIIKICDHVKFTVCRNKSELEKRESQQALVSALSAFNKYCSKKFENMPEGGIFSFPLTTIDDDKSISKWASALIAGIFENRR